MGRAVALDRYRAGAPLPFDDLRFARGDSGVAVALAWLARGVRSRRRRRGRRSPRWRRSVRTRVTRRPVSSGRSGARRDSCSGRPVNGPEPGSETLRSSSSCQRCGKPLNTDGSRSGRLAKYCGGACRTAAHRARQPDGAGYPHDSGRPTRIPGRYASQERPLELLAPWEGCVPAGSILRIGALVLCCATIALAAAGARVLSRPLRVCSV